jgi:hypothetical protein
VKAEVDLLIAKAKGGDQMAIERIRGLIKNEPVQMANDSITKTGNAVGQLTESLQAMFETIGQQVQALQADLSAPVEVVRDDNGRITGKRVGTDRRFVPLRDASNE